MMTFSEAKQFHIIKGLVGLVGKVGKYNLMEFALGCEFLVVKFGMSCD